MEMTGEIVLEYIAYLKSHVGDHMRVSTFRPSREYLYLPLHDRADALVKEMASYAGLTGCHFQIQVRKNLGSAAGRIDLVEKLGFTFVEIDDKFDAHFDTLAAVLAHELSHKFLRDKGIELLITENNEWLTDITSVYLGFGKFVLNGMCYSGEDDQCQRYSGRIGYLEPEMFAFVYDIVSSSLGQLDSDMMDGLCSDARNAIWDARDKYRKLYPVEFVARRLVCAQLENIELTIGELSHAVDGLMQSGNGNCEGSGPSVASLADQRKGFVAWFEQLRQIQSLALNSEDVNARASYLKQVAALEEKIGLALGAVKQLKSRTSRSGKDSLELARLSWWKFIKCKCARLWR